MEVLLGATLDGGPLEMIGDLPADPDLDYVAEELRLLPGLVTGVVTLICEGGISQDQLVIVPSLFAHTRAPERVRRGCTNGGRR